MWILIIATPIFWNRSSRPSRTPSLTQTKQTYVRWANICQRFKFKLVLWAIHDNIQIKKASRGQEGTRTSSWTSIATISWTPANNESKKISNFKHFACAALGKKRPVSFRFHVGQSLSGHPHEPQQPKPQWPQKVIDILTNINF